MKKYDMGSAGVVNVGLFCHRCGRELQGEPRAPDIIFIVPCSHCDGESNLAGYDRALAVMKDALKGVQDE